MSEFNIEVEGGSSVRLPTAGKYCDRDIVVTAKGGDELFRDGAYAMAYTRKMLNMFNGNDCPCDTLYKDSLHLEEVEFLFTGTINRKWNDSFNGCTNLETVRFPKLKGFAYNGFCDRMFYGCTALKRMQLGSIGFPISQMVEVAGNMPFAGCTNPQLVIEIYCNYATLSELPQALTKGSPWGATNATIVYRNSTTGEVITG